MPRFDGDPVFHALLAEDAPDGRMSVELEGLSRVEQSYEHGTAIVRTRLLDAEGRGVEITDFAPRFFHRDRVFRPAQLVRRIRPLAGHARIRISVRPLGEWAREKPIDHAWQQSSALRASERHAAADDERTADLCRRRHLVLAALAGEPAVRSRRDAVRRHRRDRPGIRGADLPLLALLDAPPRRSPGVAGGGDPRGHHPQALSVRGDGRHRRRHDDEHSGGGRTAGATGTIAFAGCAMRSSSFAR